MAAEEGLKISEMPVLDVITGREYIPVVDENGENKKMSTAELAKTEDIPDTSSFITGEQADKKYATIEQIGDINSILDNINGEVI